MYYNRATIDTLIGEHVAIRGQMALVMKLTQEWKGLLTTRESILQSQSRLQSVIEKRNSLIQAMGYLEDGLKNHHVHEEEVFPSLIGELLIKSIRIEHAEMLKMFDDIDPLVTGASIEVFLEKGHEAMQWIDKLSRLASGHSLKEDGILYFLKKLPS